MSEQNLKEIIEELIQEVEKELDEATTTGNVDGYQTPHAFSRKSDKERRKKNATQLGYSLVDNNVDNISEAKLKPKKLTQLKKGEKFVFNNNPYEFVELYSDIPNSAKVKTQNGKTSVVSFGGGVVNKNAKGGFSDYLDKGGRVWDNVNIGGESLNEAKIKRPVNRWLELKNDDTMHPHKKMAMGLKELKYQLAETEKFFTWYNKIKTMNELDSTNYWKRTQNHIYKIKERLINIAKTLQEIEK